VPEGIGPEQSQRVFAVYQANQQAFRRYRPQPSPCRVTLFRAGGDHPHALANPDLGWARLAPVEIIHVPGNHHTMMNEPHIAVLAGRLRGCLEAVAH
jgi:thioesterase domain-containing protein